MSNWQEPPDVEVPHSVRTAVGGHPLVAATLVRRRIANGEQARAFLDPKHYHPAPPTELPGMVRAVERLERAMGQGQEICVWGDFDVDGQTSTALLVSTLLELGASVRFHIPNREREGHGINLPNLKEIIETGVDVLLTCDTGIRAHAPIAYAQERGVDVIVTDHHDLPPDLPQAYAIVDPKMLAQSHALRELPGVGVAYKLAELVYDRAGRSQETRRWLDLVALGIVADVAVQTNDVRYLLQLGLEALRVTQRLGLQVLMEVANLNPEQVTEEHIGFELAPRLNALGRLTDATPAVELLTTDDLERARILAHELDALNARRKMMCDQVTQAAEAQVERDPSLLERGALVLSHPSWPGGVIGIVAGRLAEKYHQPTILIAAPPGELARGSARSVAGCDISAAIASHGEMLEGFGGHPMAAGLSIDPEQIPRFRRSLARTVRDTCEEALATEPVTEIDGYIPLADISVHFAEEIERLAPFGPGNPPLTLATRGLTLSGYTTVGRTGGHLKLTVEDREGAEQEVLWWRADESALPQGPFDLAYTVRASDYRGQRDVQVEWIAARPLEKAEKRPSLERGGVEVVDYRGIANPEQQLRQVRAGDDLVVWSEGKDAVRGRDRYGLAPAKALAIWTAPPGGPELRVALGLVSPTVVYLFAVAPGLARPKSFLTELNRLARRAITEQGGRVSLSSLAAATAQREETVRAGLTWLAARGAITILEERDTGIRLAPGDGSSSDRLPDAAGRLRALLQETKAYRQYVARAEAETLINNALSD